MCEIVTDGIFGPSFLLATKGLMACRLFRHPASHGAKDGMPSAFTVSKIGTSIRYLRTSPQLSGDPVCPQNKKQNQSSRTGLVRDSREEQIESYSKQGFLFLTSSVTLCHHTSSAALYHGNRSAIWVPHIVNAHYWWAGRLLENGWAVDRPEISGYRCMQIRRCVQRHDVARS